MISPGLLEAARPETVRATWPGIVDIDEAQAGGEAGFWSLYFPGEDPGRILDECRRLPNWSAFWNRICPFGSLKYVGAGASASGEPGSGEFEEPAFFSADECAVEVFREVVRGRLASDDPSFFLRDGPDLVLFWPFSAGESPWSRRRR